MNVSTDSLRFRFEPDSSGALVFEEVYDAVRTLARPGCRVANEKDARALADAIEDVVSAERAYWIDAGYEEAGKELAEEEEDTDDEDE